MIRFTLLCVLCLSSVLADKMEEPSPNIVSVGPWVTVRDSGWRQNQDIASAQAGLGFEANSALRFGLGAIIIMLIVSTILSIGQKLYPSIAEFMATNAQGRSLEEVSSLAQYAFEAFEKYQSLNEAGDE